MTLTTFDLAVTLGLFAGMLVSLECGYRLGRRSSDRDQRFHEGLGTIEAATFALLGLLLGFAFAGAMSRLDARRQLIIREADAISTAYLRVDLLPEADQPAVRQLFRDYLETRLRAYESDDLETNSQLIQQGTQLQHKIWAEIIRLSRNDPTQKVVLSVIPAVNEMIDVTTARTIAVRTHLPTLILDLLVVVAILSALLAGYAMATRPRRSLLHMALYAATVSITVYAMLDLDNPRLGLIRLNATEQILKNLHDTIR